jgi:RNA polymerase sigma factor (TIGR02999 family)
MGVGDAHAIGSVMFSDERLHGAPMDAESRDITTYLLAHAAGDAQAFDRLLPHVYDELRRIAQARLRRERDNHTLAPTELVHEAFLRLVPAGLVNWQNRAHFFAIASRAMRNVLVDHAVRRNAAKRGGGQMGISLSDDAPAPAASLDDLITLNDALERLEQLEPRQARVVECRFFGGLGLDETAEALQVSPATVSRDWFFARAWLHRELSSVPASPGTAPQG